MTNKPLLCPKALGINHKLTKIKFGHIPQREKTMIIPFKCSIIPFKCSRNGSVYPHNRVFPSQLGTVIENAVPHSC